MEKKKRSWRTIDSFLIAIILALISGGLLLISNQTSTKTTADTTQPITGYPTESTTEIPTDIPSIVPTIPARTYKSDYVSNFPTQPMQAATEWFHQTNNCEELKTNLGGYDCLISHFQEVHDRFDGCLSAHGAYLRCNDNYLGQPEAEKDCPRFKAEYELAKQMAADVLVKYCTPHKW